MNMVQKRMLIIGGPNGAGKTTLAKAYLEGDDWHYLGADKIAEELAPGKPESVATAAGRLFVEQLDTAIRGDLNNLVIESTLSGRSIGRNIERARQEGFRIDIAFTFVDAPSTSIARVAHRVRTGGHHVPDDDVRRRFYRSIRNFWLRYRQVADSWSLSDNRSSVMKEIAIGDMRKSEVIDSIAMNEFLTIVNSDHV